MAPRGRPKKIKTEDGEEVGDDLQEIDEALGEVLGETAVEEFDPSLPESKQRHLR